MSLSISSSFLVAERRNSGSACSVRNFMDWNCTALAVFSFGGVIRVFVERKLTRKVGSHLISIFVNGSLPLLVKCCECVVGPPKIIPGGTYIGKAGESMVLISVDE